MPNYRRAKVLGGCYFFTVVTYQRRPILIDELALWILWEAIRKTRQNYPFIIDAWVLLPDHLHCIWTLLDGDRDFSTGWKVIKTRFSRRDKRLYYQAEWMNASKTKHRESTLWQWRSWEHLIHDEEDFIRHVDYVHFNPVKHGLVERVKD